MTLDDLRWFLVLAGTEHVTEAAGRLHIDQSTLSRALRRMEKDVGSELFDRDHGRLRLNDRGRVFRRHAQRALDELDTARDRIAALLEPPHGTLALAFAPSLGSWLVPRLVAAYQREAPDTSVTLHQDAAENVPALLLDGLVDAAITSPRPSDGRIGWLPLCDEPLHLAVPAGHRLAHRGDVRLSELADEQVIIMRRALGLRQITCEVFHRAGVTPSVVAESSDVATIKAMVAAGLGVSLVPGGDGTPPSTGLCFVPLADADAYRPVGLAWHTGRPPTATARRFREFTAQYAKRLGDAAA
ncbi:LysR family transcriptional regulator [Streptomyces sp. NPDC002004]